MQSNCEFIAKGAAVIAGGLGGKVTAPSPNEYSMFRNTRTRLG